jgi:hypothetical protein
MLRTSGHEHAQLSELVEATDTPELDLERKIAVRETLAGMSALPELQREALLQTAIEGRSHDQVAAALGISSGAVRGLIYRARATLRSAATALTPFPLVSWVARAHRGAPLSEWLSDAGVRAGSVGIAGTLAKGGTMVVTVGVLAVGGAAVTKPWDNDERADRAMVVRHASPAPAVPHNGNATRRSTGVGAGDGSGTFVPGATSPNGSAGASAYQRGASVRGGGLAGATGKRNHSSRSQYGSNGQGNQASSPIISGPAGAGAISAASGAGNSPTGTTTSSDGGDSSTKTTVARSPAPGSSSASSGSDGADSGATTPAGSGKPALASTPGSTGSDGADITPTPIPTATPTATPIPTPTGKPAGAATPGSTGSDAADSSTTTAGSRKPAAAATPGSD